MLPDEIDYEPNPPLEPFELIAAPELTAEHVPIDWLVENILERGSLNLLFGEPSAGKSLIALDWAFCTAGGIAWHGWRTQQVDVVIVAGEGHVGIKRRLKALELKYNQKAPERLFISQRPAQLSDPVNAQWVADSIKAKCTNPGLVIIDTLHRNMDGDENSSQDIDVFIRPLGAAVLTVHHSGHGAKDRSRGSSSIRAAMDGEFLATKTESGITLTCCKAKDFEALETLQFSLKTTPLDGWLDGDGEPMTSVYLDYEGTEKPGGKRRKLSARDDAILTSLTDAINKHGVTPTDEIRLKFGGFDSMTGKHQKIVHIDHWRELAYKTISVDCENQASRSQALKKAFKRTRDKLFNDGFTVEYGDYVWRIYE
jgi:hypothetical protein